MALEVALASVVGGLLAAGREGPLQGLARPVVAGPLLGWVLGDPAGGLLVGVPLELLSLGAFRQGAVEREDPTALVVLATGVAVAAGAAAGTGVRGDLATLAFLAALPLVWGWYGLRRGQRRVAARAVERARERVEAGEVEEGLRLHLLPLLIPGVAMAALTLAGVAILGPWIAYLHIRMPPLALWLGTSAWALLWGAGAGVAARAGRSPWLVGAGLAVGVVLLWLGARA